MVLSDPCLQITALLRRVFPADVALACVPIGAAHPALFPKETRSLQHAVPRRRAEFAAGRHAARIAMQHLGRPAAPIPAGQDRAPLWPEGLTGSISHDARHAVAVLLPAAPGLALGVDLEPAEPLDPDLVGMICTPAERRGLGPLGEAELRKARLIFSAKEAVFKAQYPLSGAMLGFEDIEIAFTGDADFAARLTRPVGAFAPGETLAGRFAESRAGIVTGICLGRAA